MCGYVVDFMNIGIGSLRTGVFNVADIAVSFGRLFLSQVRYVGEACSM
jgi:signal peptidase II